jgi:hypothetical protein
MARDPPTIRTLPDSIFGKAGPKAGIDRAARDRVFGHQTSMRDLDSRSSRRRVVKQYAKEPQAEE